jgi:hypothetical protein
VLWEVVILLGYEDTLTEEVLVDLLAVGLWDEPIRKDRVRISFLIEQSRLRCLREDEI